MPFQKGQSGNPGGRPKIAREIVELSRADSREAYDKVAAIMRNDEHKQQLAAALAILKVAGVLRAAEMSAPAEKPSNPYAEKSTGELLKQAGVSSTLHS